MQRDFVDLPNIDPNAFERPDLAAPQGPKLTHAPRILLLYGSLRERSFSRFATFEAARLLEAFGAETRIFNPTGNALPRRFTGGPEGQEVTRPVGMVGRSSVALSQTMNTHTAPAMLRHAPLLSFMNAAERTGMTRSDFAFFKKSASAANAIHPMPSIRLMRSRLSWQISAMRAPVYAQTRGTHRRYSSFSLRAVRKIVAASSSA